MLTLPVLVFTLRHLLVESRASISTPKSKAMIRAPRAIVVEELLQGGSKALVPSRSNGGQLVVRQDSGAGSTIKQLVKQAAGQLARSELGFDPIPYLEQGLSLWNQNRAVSVPSQAVRKAVQREVVREVKDMMPSGQHVVTGMTVPNRSALNSAKGINVTNIHHATLGPGIVVRGTQLMRVITKLDNSAGAFENEASRTSMALSPYALGDFLSTLADRYQNYRFEKVRYRYVPSCPSTTAGSIRFAYSADSNVNAYNTLNYVTTATFPSQINVGAWEPGTLDIDPVPSMLPVYWQYDASGDVMSVRAMNQGVLFAFWNDIGLPEVTAGTIEVDYVCHLFNQCPSLYGMPTLESHLRALKLAEIQKNDAARAEAVKRLEKALSDRIAAPDHGFELVGKAAALAPSDERKVVDKSTPARR